MCKQTYHISVHISSFVEYRGKLLEGYYHTPCDLRNQPDCAISVLLPRISRELPQPMGGYLPHHAQVS